MEYVDACPKTLTEIKRASERLQCKNDTYGNNQYMCLPNEKKSSLVEFCFEGQMGIELKGSCLEVFGGKQINRYSCSRFSHGCPNVDFYRDKVFNYPACLEIDTKLRCYIAEPFCVNQITNNSNTDSEVWKGVAIGIVVTILIAIMIIAVVYIYRKRCKSNRKNGKTKEDASQQDEPLLRSPIAAKTLTHSSRSMGNFRIEGYNTAKFKAKCDNQEFEIDVTGPTNPTQSPDGGLTNPTQSPGGELTYSTQSPDGGLTNPAPSLSGGQTNQTQSQGGAPTNPTPSLSGAPTNPTPSRSGGPTNPTPSLSGGPTNPTPSLSGGPTNPTPSLSGGPTNPTPNLSCGPTNPTPSLSGVGPQISGSQITGRFSLRTILFGNRFFGQTNQTQSSGPTNPTPSLSGGPTNQTPSLSDGQTHQTHSPGPTNPTPSLSGGPTNPTPSLSGGRTKQTQSSGPTNPTPSLSGGQTNQTQSSGPTNPTPSLSGERTKQTQSSESRSNDAQDCVVNEEERSGLSGNRSKSPLIKRYEDVSNSLIETIENLDPLKHKYENSTHQQSKSEQDQEAIMLEDEDQPVTVYSRMNKDVNDPKST